MLRTVLGWRCRWGPGHSLPTSYTSPRAANKPLIVFPIHTDRGRHCLSGSAPPPASHADPGSPLLQIIYTVLQVSHGAPWLLERGVARRGGRARKHSPLSKKKGKSPWSQLLWCTKEGHTDERLVGTGSGAGQSGSLNCQWPFGLQGEWQSEYPVSSSFLLLSTL